MHSTLPKRVAGWLCLVTLSTLAGCGFVAYELGNQLGQALQASSGGDNQQTTPEPGGTPSDGGSGGGVTMTAVSLASLQVLPGAINFDAIGQTAQLEVTGEFSDGSRRALTARTTQTRYETSDANIASVSEDGLITAVARGDATISVSNANQTASISVTVRPPAVLVSLEVQPDSIVLLTPDDVVPLIVTGVYDDGSAADLHAPDTGTTYLSSNPSVAAVSADGLVTPVADGDASVTIAHGGFSAVVPVGVSLTSSILRSSPSQGEGAVSLSRETIVYFSTPLDPTTVTADSFYATFGGQRLPSRIYVSKDAMKATLFYSPTPLPASARVRVTLDGDLVHDIYGRKIDGDGNKVAGGKAQIDFQTLSITSVPGTSVCGRVFASEYLPGGSVNVPLQNVTISVDGAEATYHTVTDSLGNFRLEPAPAGQFFVHIDGRTATNTSIPAGAYYPFVGKSWTSVPGRETNVGDVFLPLIPAGALKTVSATADTDITFVPSVLANFPELSGLRVTIPADSLFSDDGTRGGMVGIAAVPPDRLPGALPPGLDFPVVITVQTDGATNFDRPAPVCFPNLPDPNTGQVLPPGATSALWSFNHDTGEWEIEGQMTVSADGTMICTNPGVGIVQPGWHGVQVGVQGSGGPIGAACQVLTDDAGSAVYCVNQPITFCAVITGGPGKVTWTGGDSPASGTGESFTTTYSSSGVKSVTATLTPDNGDPPVMDSGSVTVVEVSSVTATGAADVPPIGNPDLKHFVTVRGSGDVMLEAAITPDTAATRDKIEWENATPDPMNKLKASVPKAASGEFNVRVKVNGVVCKEVRVWVVWSSISGAVAMPTATAITSSSGYRIGTSVSAPIAPVAVIEPASIVTAADRPDLTGANATTAPGGTNSCGGALSGGVNARWDISRRVRIRATTTPMGLSLACVDTTDNFPSDAAVGNDDAGTGDEDNNPYNAPIGSIVGSDSPTRPGPNSGQLTNGDVGDTYESFLCFEEFARLDVDGAWQVISDPLPWRVHFKFKKVAVTEALWGIDTNGDGDMSDIVMESDPLIMMDLNGDGDMSDPVGYWDDDGSESASDNADCG